MKNERTIMKRAVFADIHQDVRAGGRLHEFSIRYVKKDGTLGEKRRCRKSTRQLPGTGKYRQNVNLNRVLLLENLENGRPFEVIIDLITHYNGRRINHTY